MKHATSFCASRRVAIAAWLVAFGATAFVAGEAAALPRMSLTAGSPCATCHVSPQGAGARNDIGWGMALDMALHTPQAFTKLETNGFADGKVMLGIDTRLQIARMGKPTADPDAKASDALFSGYTPALKPDMLVIPMQMQPYLTATPFDWLVVTGSYNFSTTRSQYPGQSPWDAQVIIHASPMAPTVRLGMIQPTIGIRHDDHTMLLRADAIDPRRPLVPAGYAEWGGEVSWQPKSWLRADAGAFLNSNLRTASQAREADPVRASSDGLGWNARLMTLPQLLDYGVNSWAGVSAMGTGELMLVNGFLGVGKDALGSLQLEASRSTGADGYQTLAFMGLASWNFKEWLVFEARLEQARADADLAGGHKAGSTRQMVLGAQFFPLPYVEIRPEYRLIRSTRTTSSAKDEYILGQYALQVHMYF